MVFNAWFMGGPKSKREKSLSLMLVLPPVITAFLALLFGFFPEGVISPLRWVRLILGREYQ
ncbi:MAG: hypothetical protein D6674_07815 [Acidobacteria bacterium]|jgi:hypothetical protein|nr:MAG: hypothetical protein D6674_07815 [Acidobacteriota bacterium]